MNEEVTYIRSEDLLDESPPQRLARSFGLTRRRQLGGPGARPRSCCRC